MPSLLGWLSRLFGRNGPDGPADGRRAKVASAPAGEIARIQSGLDRVASEVAALARTISERGLDVRIERVYIDEVNFDELCFDIDDIGVTDLQGALSIGINYGGRVVRPVEPDNPEARARPARPRAGGPCTRTPGDGAAPVVNIRFGGQGTGNGVSGDGSRPVRSAQGVVPPG